MPDQITFRVNGKLVSLSRREVELCMRGMNPEPIQRHAVEVAGTAYPVKQVFEAATGIDRLDFTSAVARHNLGKLGFILVRANG